MTTRLRTVLILAALIGSPALADSGWLAGGSVAQADLKDFRFSTTAADDSDTVFTVFGGYKVMSYYGVTAGYVDLGSYHLEGPDFGGYVTDIDIKGIHVNNLGILPVHSRIALVGALGAFVWDYDERDDDLSVMPAMERRLSDSGVSATVGLGATFDVGAKNGLGLHVGYQRFLNVGDRDTVEHENDYDVIQAGVNWFWGK